MATTAKKPQVAPILMHLLMMPSYTAHMGVVGSDPMRAHPSLQSPQERMPKYNQICLLELYPLINLK